MKNYVLFLLLFFCLSASAQVTTSVKAGLSLANVEFKGDDNYQVRVVGYGGLSFNFALPNKLFFQPELLYSIRGYGFRPTATSERHRVYFGYITAPLLMGYKLSNNFSILAGPELGYMVRARSHFDGTTASFYDGLNRKFNVDVDAGLAWQIMKELMLEARINFGVTALYRGILTDPYGNDFGEVKDGFHRVLQLGLALAL
jgi:hypothetical protein